LLEIDVENVILLQKLKHYNL